MRALVVGAKEYPDDKRSINLFDRFVKFMTECGIPTSSMRGGDVYHSVDVAYKSVNDEWLISGCYLDEFINKDSPGAVLKKIFKTINVADGDVITY